MKHQSQLRPVDNKFHVGNGEDQKHYWLTPPDLYAALDAEFQFTTDVCPWNGRPWQEGDWDGLTADWGERNYGNIPFGSIMHQGKKKGPTAWFRKAIAERRKGKLSVIVYPVDKWLLMVTQEILGEHADIRNLGDVRWCATEDGSQGKGTGRHIACFVFRPENDFQKATPTSGGVDREDNHTLVPVVFKASHYTREKDGAPSDLAPPLSADADRGDQDTLVLAFGGNMRGRDGENMPEQHEDGETASALRAESGGSTRDLVAFADVADPLVCKEGETYTQEGSGNFRVRNVVTDLIQWAVRRLTPTECERLQGAPDGYTLVKVRRVARKNNELIAQIADAGGAVIVAGKPGHERPYQWIDGEAWTLMADGPRYKMLGNSKAVPVVRWIGERIILAMAA